MVRLFKKFNMALGSYWWKLPILPERRGQFAARLLVIRDTKFLPCLVAFNIPLLLHY
jgi:hypothetical protein